MAADDVQLPDLEVIQRYSVAIRGASAPRAEVIAALQSDLDWLTAGGRRPAKAPSKPATKAATTKASAKAADKAPAAPKRAARRAPAKASSRPAQPTPASEA